MARANVKMEGGFLREDIDLESDIDLEKVKLLIGQQESKCRVKDFDIPLYQWDIPNVFNNGFCESKPFVVGRLYSARLSLKLSLDKWNVTFHLERSSEDILFEEDETFHSFQHFICRFLYYDCKNTSHERFIMSTSYFLAEAEINEIEFSFFDVSCPVIDASVEIYEEPSTTSLRVSPFKNAAVGKIEKFKETKSVVLENRMMLVSPRFNFGSADQKMIVSFWHDHRGIWGKDGAYATLCIINERKEQERPLLSCKVSITVFKQKGKGNDIIETKDLPKKGFNKFECAILLGMDFFLNGDGFLEDDTLYYKVVVEPVKPSDETAKDSN